MGKRGPKPKGKVRISWSSSFAYAIGLIVSDGNLSSNGRHITFTSKDKELIDKFQSSLGIIATVTNNRSGTGKNKKYFSAQFGDVLFHEYLQIIGIHPRKSKTISNVCVPNEFFFDFLRGVFDGDGSTYSYYDKRWKNSYMFYTIFASASPEFIKWIRFRIADEIGIKGHVTKASSQSVIQLKYAKNESLILLKKMYMNKSLKSLSRKSLKIKEMLRIIGESI
jgi:hypothetical protein